MSVDGSRFDWRRWSELTWRVLVFIVAIAILVIVTTRWNRWQGGAGWQVTDDAYLQADITPIAAKVGGYLREVPVQDYERVKAGQVLAQIVDDDYRAAVEQAKPALHRPLRKPKLSKRNANCRSRTFRRPLQSSPRQPQHSTKLRAIWRVKKRNYWRPVPHRPKLPRKSKPFVRS